MTKPGESWVVMIHLETDHVTAEAFALALAEFTDAQMEFEFFKIILLCVIVEQPKHMIEKLGVSNFKFHRHRQTNSAHHKPLPKQISLSKTTLPSASYDSTARP